MCGLYTTVIRKDLSQVDAGSMNDLARESPCGSYIRGRQNQKLIVTESEGEEFCGLCAEAES